MSLLVDVCAVVAVGAVVVHEIRADRRNREFAATAVQIVHPPAPRWWRRAWQRLVEVAVGAGFLAALLWVALHMRTGSAPARHMNTVPNDTGTPAASAVTPSGRDSRGR